jgi:hypothetical protein
MSNENVEEKICNDMKRIINYLNAKKLVLNIKKTKFMIVHSATTKVEDTQEICVKSSAEDEFKIIEEFRIERVKEMRYLGLIIDESLKWESHIKHVESKIANAAGILWKLRYTLPQDTKKRIYKALCESHINYMIEIWGTASDSIIQPLQIIQNRALRNVYNLERLTNRIEMYSTKVEDNPPIRAIFYKTVAGFIFKASKGLIYTNIVFNRVQSARRDDYLRPAIAKTLIGRRRMSAIGPRIFNDLPSEIQKSKHIHSFTKALKEQIRSEQLLSMCFNGDFLSKFS